MTKIALLSFTTLLFSTPIFAATSNVGDGIMSYLSEWSFSKDHKSETQLESLKNDQSAKPLLAAMSKILTKGSSLSLPVFADKDKVEIVNLSTEKFLEWNNNFALLPAFANPGNGSFAMIGSIADPTNRNPLWAEDRLLIVGIPFQLPKIASQDAYVRDLFLAFLQSPVSQEMQTSGKNMYPHIGLSLVDWKKCKGIPEAGQIVRHSEAQIGEMLSTGKCKADTDLEVSGLLGFVDVRKSMDLIAQKTGLDKIVRKEISGRDGSIASFGVMRGSKNEATHLVAVYQMQTLDAYRLIEILPKVTSMIARENVYFRQGTVDKAACAAMLESYGVSLN